MGSTAETREAELAALARDCVHVLEPGSDSSSEHGPDWFTRALKSFRQNVGDREYPCHFGRRALEQRELFVTYSDASDLSPLGTALASFLDYVRPTPERRQVLAAFVDISKADASHEDYGNAFWSILQYLHERDDAPWPEEFPATPDEASWEFSFHGTAMFVFAAAPTHLLRASRNLGDCLVLLFQPRNVFHGIDGGTPAGTAARRRIRDRLQRWDVAPSHPSMGNYGDPSNFEWRQYFIPDDASDMYDTCPFQASVVSDPEGER
ncbi:MULTISPECIES: YqcI/YcgG family protein [Streptomyces]|uniref:YqcI/YcgG family protein n=1 Tax=Streptomyces TaxID=1883 RepID=UPI001300CA9C|nr:MULTISPECIES: YqcI/YcgG family protein [unclassified Streptomyces]QNQ37548.1 YqcI/YcgG family protein [Streptomyces sp. CB00271]